MHACMANSHGLTAASNSFRTRNMGWGGLLWDPFNQFAPGFGEGRELERRTDSKRA